MIGWIRWFLSSLWPEQELRIDLRRINDEDRLEHRRQLEDDVGYRERVKRRMREGLTDKQLKPLYNRPQILKQRKAKPTYPRLIEKKEQHG